MSTQLDISVVASADEGADAPADAGARAEALLGEATRLLSQAETQAQPDGDLQQQAADALKGAAACVPEDAAQRAACAETLSDLAKRCSDAAIAKLQATTHAKLLLLGLKHGFEAVEAETVFSENAQVNFRGMALGGLSVQTVRVTAVGAYEKTAMAGAILRSPFEKTTLDVQVGEERTPVQLVRMPVFDMPSLLPDHPLMYGYSFTVARPAEEPVSLAFWLTCAAGSAVVPIAWGRFLKREDGAARFKNGCSFALTEKKRRLRMTYEAVLEAGPSEFGWPSDQAVSQARFACREYGVTPVECFDHALYNLQDAELSLACTHAAQESKLYRARLDRLEKATGKTSQQVVESLVAASSKSFIPINLYAYEKLGLWSVPDAQLPALLGRVKAKNGVRNNIRQAMEVWQRQDQAVAEAAEEYAKLVECEEQLLSDEYIAFVGQRLEGVADYSSPQQLRHLVADIEATKEALRFTENECVTFRMWDLPFVQKSSYLSGWERAKLFDNLNDYDSRVLLNDKGACYQLLGPYYRRDCAVVRTAQDYPAFKQLAKAHKEFLVKPLKDSMGRGVHLASTGALNRKSTMERLLAEDGSFIAEERIVQHEHMAAVNASSVNTVRVPTFNDNGKCVVHSPFVKFGRGGSLVDNAGQGGVYCSVDAKTGAIMGPAVDEAGNTYERHPQSGIVFEGYQLPCWENALALAQQVFDKVPGARYIGWDFACTESGEWVIVEGNALTQFVCQQSSRREGIRQEFLETIHVL